MQSSSLTGSFRRARLEEARGSRKFAGTNFRNHFSDTDSKNDFYD